MSGNRDAAGGVRRRNLSRVLQLVHIDGPLSRASLTAATGLNRSTVADLVGELGDLGLVTEGVPRSSQRAGRPSPEVSVTADVLAIAANPEVDALEVAAVGLDRSIPIRQRIELDHLVEPEEAARLIAQRVDDWRAGALSASRIVAIGVAVPGLVRAADGLVRHAPHLQWVDAPLCDLVAEATGVPTVVGNDASLGALAEHLFGAGRGVADLVYLNGGASGIGGGLVVDGVHVGGAGGYAGELGQNALAIPAESDQRSAGGVFEDEVNRARLLEVLGLPTADDSTLAAANESAGETARAEFARQRRVMATGLAGAVNVLNPALIVLGGFLAALAARDLEELLESVRAQAMHATADALEMRIAALGEDRLLIGAAEAAFTEILRNPRGMLGG